MQFPHRARAALIAASVALGVCPAGASAARHKLRLPADYRAWSRVADCESGGWQVLGSAYPDSLGITRTNYTAFGGRPLPPGRASLKQQVMQIRVADRLIRHYHIPIPDQSGCAAW